uniref:NADH-ubiquinone oxidoreductase chain 2 n=1 Tax=Tenuibranchiurus glypticus TaxID=99779 RepID=A0A0A0R1K7_9EUCA|nr:NADH dehydrogenase subunit 2 [Tenuibranchiurus glypticus]AIU94544.1 NADH dehydrogenase subunit 2 [Tenuibranchiurus glypticus]
MAFSPYSMVFIFFTFSGAFLAISSTSWFIAWLGLELNLISFLPLISSKTNLLSSEAALKYFLIQALGSAIIIFSTTLPSMTSNLPLTFLALALLLKMGAAPLHFWFPQIMEGMNWFYSTLLMTLQKLAPMFLISYLTTNLLCWTTISLSAASSAIIGALGGLNQSSLRKILAFSSINHMSWMLFSMLINETSWVIYFTLYALITSSITMLFSFLQAYYFSNLINPHCLLLPKTTSMLALFSLGGLPPFSGFLPKWIIAQEMISSSYFYTLTILLLSSLVTLYFYLRLTLSSLSLSHSQNKHTTLLKASPLKTIFLSLNLFGLLAPSALFIF